MECSYYFPDASKIVFSSSCDAEKDSKFIAHSLSKKYMYNQGRELYLMNLNDYSIKRLTDNNAYEAEVSFSPNGKKILFTYDRDGNLEIYSMDLDGANVIRLTNTPMQEFI